MRVGVHNHRATAHSARLPLLCSACSASSHPPSHVQPVWPVPPTMSRLQGFCLCLLAFLKPSACLASSCADRPRPCVEVSGGNAQVSLQAGNFHSSVLNYGSFSGRALSLLQHGQCLQIMAIGGSVTCGHCLDRNSTQLPSERTAWPSALANLLNNELPCHNSSGMLSNHVVTNVCAGGWSTALWLERISASLRSNEDLHAALTTADVIIVETAVNDIEELRRHDMRASARDQPLPVLIMRATELLVNILLTLDNKPSIVYLGASSRALWGGGPRHSGDAILDQLEVVRLYNIPYVSAIEGLGPFTTAVGRSWFLDVYRCDLCCHPACWGTTSLLRLSRSSSSCTATMPTETFCPTSQTPFTGCMTISHTT